MSQRPLGGLRWCVVRMQVFSLREQILHKCAFLREHMLLPGRPPVMLLGHSIGMLRRKFVANTAMLLCAVVESKGVLAGCRSLHGAACCSRVRARPSERPIMPAHLQGKQCSCRARRDKLQHVRWCDGTKPNVPCRARRDGCSMCGGVTLPNPMKRQRSPADPRGVPLPHSGSPVGQAAPAEGGRLRALAAGGSCPAAGQPAGAAAALDGFEVCQRAGPACASMRAGPAALADRQERLLPGAARVPAPGKASRLPPP